MRTSEIICHIALGITGTYLKKKGNQKIKLRQLTQHKMSNIFSKNHTQSVVEKLVPDPYLKNQN